MTRPRPGAEPRYDWTEARVAELERLYGLGIPASKIAVEMQAPSRSAVCGKIHRLKLHRERPSKPAKVAKPKLSGAQRRKHNNFVAVNMSNQAIRAQAKAFGETRVPPAFVICGAGHGTTLIEKPAGHAPRGKINVRAWEPLEGSEPVTLMGLRSGCCKWPVELPGEAETYFCALPSLGTYCLHHAKRGAAEVQPGKPTPPAVQPIPRRRAA